MDPISQTPHNHQQSDVSWYTEEERASSRGETRSHLLEWDLENLCLVENEQWESVHLSPSYRWHNSYRSDSRHIGLYEWFQHPQREENTVLWQITMIGWDQNAYDSENVNRNGCSEIERWLIKISSYQRVEMCPIRTDGFQKRFNWIGGKERA